MVCGVRCGARLGTGQCNNQTTSNDRYPTRRFNMAVQSDTPASTVADSGPTTADKTVVDRPFRQPVSGVM